MKQRNRILYNKNVKCINNNFLTNCTLFFGADLYKNLIISAFITNNLIIINDLKTDFYTISVGLCGIYINEQSIKY